MKSCIIAIFSLIISTSCSAQKIAADDFIRLVMSKGEKINYTKTISPSLVHQLKEALLSDTIKIYTQANRQETALIIDNRERDLVNQELNAMMSYIWPDNLFEHVSYTTKDSTSYRHNLYSFSKPIFFRNNTLCILYKAYSCGEECGEGDVSVYKFENGKWKYWISLSHWVS